MRLLGDVAENRCVNRRAIALIVTLALVVLAAPLAIEAQPTRLPLVAILDPGLPSNPSVGTVHFKQALEQFGWVEGRTVRFETRATASTSQIERSQWPGNWWS